MGSTHKIWKMTQNSPPPPQLLTFTKQSDLMSYFNKKQNRKLKDNEQFDKEAMACESDDDEDPLPKQFGFLSQEEEEKTLNSPESNKLTSRDNVASTSNVDGNDVVFLTEGKTKLNTNVHPGKTLNYNERETINEPKNDFHTMDSVNISVPKLSVSNKKSANENTDESSDIDFLSNSPNSNSEAGYLKLEEKKYGERNKLANYIVNSELSEDIEFISQREQQNYIADSEISKDIEFISQREQHNLVVQPVKNSRLFTSEDSFTFETVICSPSDCHSNEKRYPIHKDKNNLRNSEINAKCVSTLYMSKRKLYLHSNTRNLLVIDNSDIDFENQSSAEEICVPVKTGLKGSNFKGLNSNSYYRGRHSFEDLPETIKFTESETDSCEDVMTRHKM